MQESVHVGRGDAATKCGVDYGQGFLFAQPLSVRELRLYLDRAALAVAGGRG